MSITMAEYVHLPTQGIVSKQCVLRKKATIHQVTTMQATFKKSYFHVLTTSTDDPSLAGAGVIIKVSGHQYRWLA